MNKIWKEIPELFLSYAWKMSIGAFIIFGIVHSAAIAVFDNKYGMIEGIGVGIAGAFGLMYFTDARINRKRKMVDDKVKDLIREAHHCSQLATEFERDGKHEIQRQYIEDYNKKRHQILQLLGGEVKPEDIP